MAQTAPYLDPSLKLEERIDDLLGCLTAEEKCSLLWSYSPAIDRLGIPAYHWWNECLHGVARAGRATVFPQSIGLAATFDVPLIGRIARAISDEARAKHHQALRQGNRGKYFGLTFWSPNINIFRDPRWGRGQETYGECPYLTSRLAVAFVKGLQGRHETYLKLVDQTRAQAPAPLVDREDARLGTVGDDVPGLRAARSVSVASPTDPFSGWHVLSFVRARIRAHGQSRAARAVQGTSR